MLMASSWLYYFPAEPVGDGLMYQEEQTWLSIIKQRQVSSPQKVPDLLTTYNYSVTDSTFDQNLHFALKPARFIIES